MKLALLATLLISFMCNAMHAHAAGKDIFVSVEEQQQRDNDKIHILNNEIAMEKLHLSEKKQLLAIAESMQNGVEAASLNSQIRQHALNIEMLTQEIKLSTGARQGQSTFSQTRQRKSTPKQKTTADSPWWDTYSRNVNISTY